MVRDLIHEGCSIVLTTHYLEEAEALADRVAVIAHGRLVAGGSVDEIRAHVSRKTIQLQEPLLAADPMRAWPEVLQLNEEAGPQSIVTRDAERCCACCRRCRRVATSKCAAPDSPRHSPSSPTKPRRRSNHERR